VTKEGKPDVEEWFSSASPMVVTFDTWEVI
jgi:hypothetical protein